MSKKLYFLISFVLVLSLAGNVLAYETMVWDNDLGVGDRLWQTTTNWTWMAGGEPKRAPIASDFVLIGDGDYYGDPCHGPIINADTNAVAEWVDIGGYYAQALSDEVVLTMTGGTLTCGTWFELGGYQPGTFRFDISGGTLTAPYIWVGYVAGAYATMNISDGNIITDTSLSIGIENTAQGDVNMTGGDVNLGGWLEIGSFDACEGVGHLDLHGGTITTILLSMGGGGVGTMDLAGGTLIIDGDYRIPNGWLFDPCSDDDPNFGGTYTGTIAILADRGLITAYNTNVGDIITDGNYPSQVGLRAVINLDYDVTNPGQTTLTAGAVDPNWAAKPQPLFGAGGLLATNITQISWAAGTHAASHEVYFGTSFAEVNDANNSLPVGTSVYKGNQPLADVNYPVSVTWDTTYYWRIDEVNDPTTWKGTVWNFVTIPAWATNPSPGDGATGVSPLSPVLKWDKGPVVADVNGHHVYFSSDFNDVNERDPDPNVLTVRDTNNYTPGALEMNTRYYWAVDEVNLGDDPNVWPSPVWNFTTADHLVVDNFNSYATNEEIKVVWKCYPEIDTKAEIFRETTLVRDGNSMKFNYYNEDSPGDKRKYSESEAAASALWAGTDWTVSGVEALVLYFRGAAGNSAQPLYLVLSDGTNEGMVTYDDANGTQEEFWHTWNIDLEDPCFIAGASPAAVDMNNVLKVYLGVGIRGEMTTGGGEGDVYFDDIGLFPPRCRSGLVETDFTGDCITDYNDVDIMARDWLMYDYNVPAVAISSPPVGWWKLDEGSGDFTEDSSTNNNDGTIFNENWVVGYPNDPCNSGLHFDGDGIAYYDRVVCAERSGTDPGIYPAELMPATFTVACWVKCDSFEYFNTFVADGVDYGYTGNDSSGFHLFSSYAAAGSKDFGLGIRTVDSINYVVTPSIYETDTWYHVAATYNDANTVSVYVDGKLATGPTDVGGPIRWKNPLDSNNYPDYFVIGELPAMIGTTEYYYANGIIDDVRVYNYALPYGEIVTLAEQGPVLYHDVISPANIYDLEAKTSKIVNFRDYVILADHWLEGPTLWP